MAPILVSTELRTYDTELTVGLPRYVWSDGKRPSQWDGTSFDEPQMEVRSDARVVVSVSSTSDKHCRRILTLAKPHPRQRRHDRLPGVSLRRSERKSAVPRDPEVPSEQVQERVFTM